MCRGLNVCKTSRRDLALVMAKGLDGATTVSATMLLAARAGIHVFVTGGEECLPQYHVSFTALRACQGAR